MISLINWSSCLKKCYTDCGPSWQFEAGNKRVRPRGATTLYNSCVAQREAYRLSGVGNARNYRLAAARAIRAGRAVFFLSSSFSSPSSFFAGRTAISYWVDLLWFSSLGYASVFWKTWAWSGAPSRSSRRSRFCVLFGAFFAAAPGARRATCPTRHTIFFGGRPIDLPVGRVLALVAAGALRC